MEYLKNKTLAPLKLIPFSFSFGQSNPSTNPASPLFKSGVINDRFITFSEYQHNTKYCDFIYTGMN